MGNKNKLLLLSKNYQKCRIIYYHTCNLPHIAEWLLKEKT